MYFFRVPNWSKRCFLRCRQVEISSVLRLRDGRAVIMKNFSCVHKLHCFDDVEYGVAFVMIFQSIECCVLLSFSCQMCSLKVVELRLWLSLKEDLCCVYRVLNVFSVSPM